MRRSGRKTCKPAAVSGRLFQRFSGQALHTAVLSVTDLCVSTLCLSFRVPASSMPSCLDLGEDVCDCVLPERLKQVTCRRTCCAMVLCLAQRRSVTVESPRELADRDFGGSLLRESVLVTAVSTGPCSRVGLSSRGVPAEGGLHGHDFDSLFANADFLWFGRTSEDIRWAAAWRGASPACYSVEAAQEGSPPSMGVS